MKMTAAAIGMLAVLTCLLAGCCATKPPAQPACRVGVDNTQAKDGLSLTVQTDKRNYVREDWMQLTVIAQNNSDKDITFVSSTGAPVTVTVSRQTPTGWEDVATYPETMSHIVSTWKLAPGQSRTFPMSIPISPNLPTAERLRVSAQVNGRTDVVAGGLFQVFPDAASCNRNGVWTGQ